MSLKSLIERNVNRAFVLLKDLVVTVTIQKNEAFEYDFESMSPAVGLGSTSTVRAIKLSEKLKSKDGAHFTRTSLLFIKKEVAPFGDFNRVTLEGVEYDVERPIYDNGFVVKASLRDLE